MMEANIDGKHYEVDELKPFDAAPVFNAIDRATYLAYRAEKMDKSRKELRKKYGFSRREWWNK